MAAERVSGISNGVDLGVTGWIVLLQNGVVRYRNNLVAVDDACAKRPSMILR